MKVSIICVTTLCGRIEPAGIGSSADRRRLEDARSRTGASLLGASSLRKGEPEMRCKGGIIPETRIRAFITESGAIPLERKVFTYGPKPLIFTSGPGSQKLIENGVDAFADIRIVGRVSSGGLSLADVIDELKERGVKKMLIEGGGMLNYNALRQEVVDEILLTLAPRISGCSSMASLVSGPDHLGRPFVDFELVDIQPSACSHELFLTYRPSGL